MASIYQCRLNTIDINFDSETLLSEVTVPRDKPRVGRWLTHACTIYLCYNIIAIFSSISFRGPADYVSYSFNLHMYTGDIILYDLTAD